VRNCVDRLEYRKLRNRGESRLRKWRLCAYYGLHNRVPVHDHVGFTQPGRISSAIAPAYRFQNCVFLIVLISAFRNGLLLNVQAGIGC